MSTSDGSKPLDVQVGGNHYKTMAIQPMEYSMANKLDACQHTIIKYVTRFREKGGIQDLEKAKHCIDLLIHFERQAATVKESLTVHPVHPATFDHIDPADVEIASAIDDDSERMQAIGQNGEMAAEVYAAVDAVDPWSGAPEWAKYKAQDCNGCWYWFDFMPEQHNIEWRVGHSRGVALYASPGDKNPNWACTLIARK